MGYNQPMKLRRVIGFVLIAVGGVLTAPAEILAQGPFIIDYDVDDQTIAEDTLSYLQAAEAEFAPHLPFGEEPVKIRIASSLNEFLGLSGTYAHVGVNGVTRASQNLIALKSPRLRTLGDDYRGTVRHELVHVLLHRNTNTTQLPRWLNEGVCMLLANELRWGSTLQVAQMHLSGQMIPLRDLDRAFAMPGSDHQFGNAYAQALSMTRELRDQVGDEAFWAVVLGTKDTSFAAALQAHGDMSPEEFWKRYSASLWLLTVISVLRTGSFWGAISFLCIIAFLVRHWRNRAIVRRWEAEEQEEELEDAPFDWDSILPDADEWKG